MIQNSINFLSKILGTFVPRRVVVGHPLKYLTATTTVFVALLISTPSAQAQNVQDMAAAMARMDDIIAEMLSLRAEFASLMPTTVSTAPTPAVLGAATSKVLTMDISFGATNEDIARIQRLLATDPEIYPYGVASGFFGSKTEEAIKNLQARNGWDTPGVIGPATRALLDGYLAAYPNENYPADVLQSKPPAAPVQQVLGATTSVTPTPTPVAGAAKSIDAEYDRGEAEVRVVYQNGNRISFIVGGDTESQIVDKIVGRTPLTKSDVLAVIDFHGLEDTKNNSHEDENAADDALNDAEDALDAAEKKINKAEDDGEDIDWADDIFKDAEDKFDEADASFEDEDWGDAIDLAKETEDLANEAEDAIGEEKGSKKGDSDEIDKIKVEVSEDESDVTVKYDNDSDYEFTVEEDKEDEIIKEVADELDLGEDDVADLIRFDFGDIDSIDVRVYEDDDEARATVRYESNVKRRFDFNTADEDEIIGELSDELDEDENDVEDWTNFDY